MNVIVGLKQYYFFLQLHHTSQGCRFKFSELSEKEASNKHPAAGGDLSLLADSCLFESILN